MKTGSRWTVVAVFAVAMAWVEAAVVFDLRTMIDRIIPYQAHPLPQMDALGWGELVREAATLVMLGAVGWLAGTTWRSRAAYAAVAFGVWDIFYYVFLRVLTGWPQSLLDWDVLFLLPIPWWGPVLAPVLISVLMIAGGTTVAVLERRAATAWPPAWGWAAGGIGIVVALCVFMSDALRTLPAGEAALRDMLPVSFNWLLFTVAYLLMATPVAQIVWRMGLAGPSGRQTGDLSFSQDTREMDAP